jgi:hypothetical protein
MRLPRVLAGCLLAAAILAPSAAGAGTPYNVQVLANHPDGTSDFTACGVGGSYRFPTIPGSAVGQVWTVDVDMSTSPWTVTNPRPTGKTSCSAGVAPGQTTGPGQTSGPGKTTGPLPGVLGGGDGLPDFAGDLPAKAFTKVVTFRADADGFAGGELSVTFTSKNFGGALEDADGLVLVGKFVKVFRKGDRVKRGKLDDADEVAVKGKLLPTAQWHEDEDGNPVPTVRAKRITILG